jgi:hypothetical protein
MKNEAHTKMDMRTEMEVERPADAFWVNATSAMVSSTGTYSIEWSDNVVVLLLSAFDVIGICIIVAEEVAVELSTPIIIGGDDGKRRKMFKIKFVVEI